MSQTLPTVDHFLNLERELYTLIAQRDYILKQKTDIVAKVASAKARLSFEDEVKDVLEKLQYEFYSRNLKDIEMMLTAMMKETLPHIENASIKLDLYNKAGVSALDIYLEKGTSIESAVSTSTKRKSKKVDEPLLEDVYEDNGGALTNVISVGAQFIALANTTQRRFISLDEPDCWIKPDRILDFSSIITQVAKKSGFQVLYVSHHSLDHLAKQANVAKLTSEMGKLAFHSLHVNDTWENEDVPGIRGIELINFKSHEHTFLKMYPGVNYVIGENNLGKSVVSSAIRAVAYNESKDSCIRHWFDENGVKQFADQAQVIIYLEKGNKLIWTRTRKGSPKVQYELQNPLLTQPKIEDGEKSKIIDWVKDLLGIHPTDDLDIQLINQKNPVFLLDEKSSTRAKILSVGQEQLYVQEGQEKYKQLVREDKKTVKEGEDFLFKLMTQLEKFELLLLQVNKELAKEYAKVIHSVENNEKLFTKINMLSAEQKLREHEIIEVKKPELKSTVLLQKWLSIYFHLQKLNIQVELPKLPALTDQTQFVNQMRLLSYVKNISTEKIELPTLPILTDTSIILEKGKKLKEIEDTTISMDKDIKLKKEKFTVISKEKEHFIQHVLHNHCPLCMADNFKDRVQ